MSPTEQAEDERHDSISDLLGSGGINMDELETEVGSQGRIDSAVSRAEAENKLVGAESALGGTWKERERMEKNSGGCLDLAIGEATEWEVLDGCDTC